MNDYRLTFLNADRRIQAAAPNRLQLISQPFARVADGIDVARLADVPEDTSATLRRVPWGLRVGSYILFSPGTISAELRQITSVTDRTIIWSNALDNAHAAGSEVLILERPETIPQWFGAAADGVTDDGPALRAWAEQHRQYVPGHGVMHAPTGTYSIGLAPHPENANIPVGFWSLCLRGDGKGKTIFKLRDSQALFGTKAPYIVGNYEVGSRTESDVLFEAFTIDGNALNQIGQGWSEMAGLKFSKTRRGWADSVLVKNIYSTGHSPDSEGFAIKWSTGADGGAINCETDNDDSSGYESSGFSMSSCINMRLIGCHALNSPQGNCFTANKGWQLQYIGCLAQKSGDTEERTGFNCENCHYVTYSSCIAGGFGHNINNVDPYTISEDLGCRVGWVINSTASHVTLDGCQSANTSIGVIVKGASTATRIVGGCQFVGADKGVRIDISDGVLASEVYIAPDTQFSESVTADVALNGGPGSVTWRGYNTPTLPATGVAYANAYPADCLVGITGGALTDVSIKSAPGATYRPVGSGPGMYVVPHGASIRVSYSSAPTWYWIIGA